MDRFGFDDWRLRMSRAAEEQARLQKEEKERLAAQASPSPPTEPGLWNGLTGLQRMVVSLRAQERQEADERRPRPAPQPAPPVYIDGAYAQALGQKLQGAAAEAVQKVEARKQWVEKTKEPK